MHISMDQKPSIYALKKKNPKLLKDKFDGPDEYSTIGSIAWELSELSHTFKSKIDSKKASVQVEFHKYKYNTKIEINKMKSDWVNAFKEMKLVLFKSIQNVKQDITSVRNE